MANEAAVEAIMELVCDHYCKYPFITNEFELEKVCAKCNIESYVRNLSEGKENVIRND